MMKLIINISAGELVTIDGRFNTDTYLEILEEVMLPTVRAMTGLEEFNYVQVSIKYNTLMLFLSLKTCIQSHLNSLNKLLNSNGIYLYLMNIR